MSNTNKTPDKDVLAQAVERMRECANHEPETGHSIADEILCDVLTREGYGELVDEWRKLIRWYS